MKKTLTLCLCMILFCIIAYLVSFDKTTTFDQNIYKIITFSKSPIIKTILCFITSIGGVKGIVIVTILCFIFFKDKKNAFLVLINVILIFLLNQILKNIFMRDRPFDLMLIDESGYSFPSGHAMMSMGYYGFMVYLVWQANYRKKVKYIFTILLSILIISIGISRIYLGVHFPTDILAGYLISISYLIVFTHFIKRRPLKWLYYILF